MVCTAWRFPHSGARESGHLLDPAFLARSVVFSPDSRRIVTGLTRSSHVDLNNNHGRRGGRGGGDDEEKCDDLHFSLCFADFIAVTVFFFLSRNDFSSLKKQLVPPPIQLRSPPRLVDVVLWRGGVACR